jgi:hypothetical protein
MRSFARAIEKSSSHTKPPLLLGNGFSIPWPSPSIFRYETLSEQVDFSTLSDSAKAMFAILDTSA